MARMSSGREYAIVIPIVAVIVVICFVTPPISTAWQTIGTWPKWQVRELSWVTLLVLLGLTSLLKICLAARRKKRRFKAEQEMSPESIERRPATKTRPRR